MSEQKTAAELAEELKAAQQKALDGVKATAEDALGKAAKGEELSRSIKEQTDEALTKLNTLTEQVSRLEQRDDHNGADEDPKTLGQAFIESESVKRFLESSGKRGRVDLEFKAPITSATTDTDGAVGAAVNETRLPGIITPPDRSMTIRDLITPGRMDGSTLEYVRETGFNNNADMVAEGAKKPQSDIKLDLVSTSAKVIAHTSKASRQILDDFSQLQTYIDGRLRYGLEFKEEQQLLAGDGTGQNLHGILPQATAFSHAFVPDSATSIDTLRLAMLQAALAEYPATGHVLNPIDWAKIELTKDGDGRHIIGDPQGTLAPTLWALPVVTTQAIAADTFLTGAFRLGAQVFDRWMSRVEIATENEDDFVKNMVTVLAEERLALAVYRPEAFITGSIAPVTA